MVTLSLIGLDRVRDKLRERDEESVVEVNALMSHYNEKHLCFKTGV